MAAIKNVVDVLNYQIDRSISTIVTIREIAEKNDLDPLIINNLLLLQGQIMMIRDGMIRAIAILDEGIRER